MFHQIDVYNSLWWRRDPEPYGSRQRRAGIARPAVRAFAVQARAAAVVRDSARGLLFEIAFAKVERSTRGSVTGSTPVSYAGRSRFEPDPRNSSKEHATYVNPGVKALERRLANEELTEEDRAELAKVRQVVILRREGATILECARKTGQTERRLQQFMKRGVFKLYQDYILRLERGEDTKQVQEIVRGARESFAQFAPDAIDFYRECYLRNPVDQQEEKGVFKDPARAEWATERVSKGIGLTEPDVATRPVINIHSAIIVGEMNVVAHDDAKAERDVIEVTATKVD